MRLKNGLMRFLSLLLLVVITFQANCLISSAQVDHQYDDYGTACFAIDSSSGKVVAMQNPDLRLPLASLTKLMTAQVLLELPINWNRRLILTEGQIDYVKPFIEAGDVTSSIDLRAGDKVTMRDLWNALLIASSNEAAVALVDNSGLSREQFTLRMNEKASEFGLKDTHFTEFSGIDPRNVGTASEMAVIARKAFENKSIRIVSAREIFKFREKISGRVVAIQSRNSALLNMKPYGFKVGYLTEARHNLAMRIVEGRKDRVMVVMHAPSSAQRNAEIRKLWEL